MFVAIAFAVAFAVVEMVLLKLGLRLLSFNNSKLLSVLPSGFFFSLSHALQMRISVRILYIIHFLSLLPFK